MTTLSRVARPFNVGFRSRRENCGCPVLAIFARAGTILHTARDFDLSLSDLQTKFLGTHLRALDPLRRKTYDACQRHDNLMLWAASCPPLQKTGTHSFLAANENRR
jgi:hypothetical protein